MPRVQHRSIGDDEREPARILAGIKCLLSLKINGRGRPDVKAELCHYDDDDSLECPGDKMEFILVTHEWFSVKISLYPTWDGASNRMDKRFWCSRMIISRVGSIKAFAGYRAFYTTMLRTGLKFLQEYYRTELEKTKKTR